MSTVTPFHALAAGGESVFSTTAFTAVLPGPSGPAPETVVFAVPSGDRNVGTVGHLTMPLDHVLDAAAAWLAFRNELCADQSLHFRRTDRLDASELASGRGRPGLASRGLYRVEKRAYRGVFPRGLDVVGTMPGATPGTVYRDDTSSARMTELFLDQFVMDHDRTGRPAVAVVPATALRSSWCQVNSTRVETTSPLAAALFPSSSPVGLLLEAAGFPAYGAFLHQKQDRGAASDLLAERLPDALPVHLPEAVPTVAP
ncbi:hypothetical protein ACFXGT_05980 [Streptomyces sp. NPDC059352]|uniref:hypothetical protein n=1 Tax=Streptomyces sp. NPDC059352 TaxID=3346810 RepID=UPI0036BF1225